MAAKLSGRDLMPENTNVSVDKTQRKTTVKQKNGQEFQKGMMYKS